MAKIRFVDNSLHKTSTVTASSAATGYAATNVQNDYRSVPWRSATTTGNQTLDFDLGGSKTIRALVVMNPVIHTGGTLKGQYWNGSSWVDLGTFTLPLGRTNLAVLWVNQATTKIRLLFTNTGGVSAFVEVGTVMIADATGYLDCPINYTDGAGYLVVDPSITRASEGGQEQSWQKQKFVTVSFRFADVDGTQKDALLALLDRVGTIQPVVIALDPAVPDQIIYGRFTGLPTQHNVLNLFHLNATAKELL